MLLIARQVSRSLQLSKMIFKNFFKHNISVPEISDIASMLKISREKNSSRKFETNLT